MRRILIALSVIPLILGGAYYILQYLPEVDPSPKNGPVAELAVASATDRQPLTTAIRNPAGLAFIGETGTWLVTTDDRVFAELAADFGSVISQVTLAHNPLGAGDTEGVAYLGGGRAVVTGENGVVIAMQRNGDGWRETGRFAIGGFEAGTQLGSAAYNPLTDTLYTAQKKGAKLLYAIDLATRTVSVRPMKLAHGLAERPGRKWSEFTIAGLTFHDGRLYAISEAYSSLLAIETDGIVSGVVGLDNINESAGISISDNSFKLIGDAENYLPDPPIYIVKTGIINARR